MSENESVPPCAANSEAGDKLPAVAFVGAGSMAGALVSGLLNSPVRAQRIQLSTRSTASAAAWASRGVTAFAIEDDPEANRLAVSGAKLVVIAVKPYLVPEVLRDIASALEPDAVVVSVAAGVTLATIEAALPATVSVIRAMPNTPARVGHAVTGISPGSRAGQEELALARSLFSTAGEEIEVPEIQLDALSTISGSGPAYVFFLIEALTEAAVAKGFTFAQARLLVEKTFLGACVLLEASEEEPRELRRQVTSPKGTTEQAIAVLDQADLAGLFGRATDAALARARQLAAGN